MKIIILLVLSFFLTNPSFAGSGGTAIIKGRSGTGRTHLELHTTEIGYGVKYVKFTIDGKSYEFDVKKELDTYGYVIHDHKNKVFTVFIDNKQITFKFWMIPNKQKVIEQKGTSEKWEFYAYVEATDPREFTDETRNEPLAPPIYLFCTLDYNL